MICTKCNHTLPDDSEFCQYCGGKITRNPAPSVVVDQPTGDIKQDDALKTVLKMHAQTTVETMHANEQAQPNNERDPDFGLVPEKPIFTHALRSVDGQRAYLDKLRTPDGQKLRYER